MNIVSIKSFWNNGFHKGCDKDKLLVAATDDINKLLEEIEILQNALDKIIDKNNETAEKANEYKKALQDAEKFIHGNQNIPLRHRERLQRIIVPAIFM